MFCISLVGILYLGIKLNLFLTLMLEYLHHGFDHTNELVSYVAICQKAIDRMSEMVVSLKKEVCCCLANMMEITKSFA